MRLRPNLSRQQGDDDMGLFHWGLVRQPFDLPMVIDRFMAL